MTLPCTSRQNTPNLVAAVEAYLADLRRIRASAGVKEERSYEPPLITHRLQLQT